MKQIHISHAVNRQLLTVNITTEAHEPVGCDIGFPDDFCLNNSSDLELTCLSIGCALNYISFVTPKIVHHQLPSMISAEGQNSLLKVIQMAIDACQLTIGNIHRPIQQVNLSAPTVNGYRLSMMHTHTDSTEPLPPKRTILLLSGGVDSMVALMKLLSDGYTVIPLHISGLNLDNANEKTASTLAAKSLGLPLKIVDVEWKGLRKFGKKYASRIFDNFPKHNSIPFGRDLLMLSIAALFAKKYHAQNICIANEHEMWDRPPLFVHDRLVFRTELASKGALQPLNDILVNCFHSNLRYWSPIASMTKFAVVNYAMQHCKDMIPNLSSCYWGNWCGECPKCLTYGLLLHEYKNHGIEFLNNPIQVYGDNVNMLEAAPSSPAIYGVDSQRAGPKSTPLGGALREPLGLANVAVLAKLLEEKGLPEGTAFEQFRHSIYPSMRKQTNAIREFLLSPQVS